MPNRTSRSLATLLTIFTMLAACASSEPFVTEDGSSGPYNLRVVDGSTGEKLPWTSKALNNRPGSAWSISAWVKTERVQPGVVVLMGLGEAPVPESCRCLLLRNGRVGLWSGGEYRLESATAILPGHWVHILATYDGWTARLYVRGEEVAMSKFGVAVGDQEFENIPEVSRQLLLVPRTPSDGGTQNFAGWLAELSFHPRFFRPREAAAMSGKPPGFETLVFREPGAPAR